MNKTIQIKTISGVKLTVNIPHGCNVGYVTKPVKYKGTMIYGDAIEKAK